MNLENKIVLITGANGGLGQAFIKYCLENNIQKIYCCARDIKNIDAIDKPIESIKLDLTNLTDINNLESSIDSIDILVNNAGVNNEKRIFEALNNDFEVNTFSTLNICKALYPKIKENGSIITINSVLAFMNLPIMAQYCASKSALHSIMQAIRAELGTKSINVFEVFPGPIDTRMSQNLKANKAIPYEIVKEVFNGVNNKTFEIFPDDFSKNIILMLKNNPEQLEKEYALSIQK